MPWRLHRSGRLRAWLGRRFGGDAELGDRVLRRLLHGAGVAVLLYFLLPAGFFLVLPTSAVLLLALATVLAVEGLRLAGAIEMPTIRPYERHRIASYAWYAIALTAAVLLFPAPVAVVAVLGVAAVDPLFGELRMLGARRWYPAGPVAAYAGIAVAVLLGAGWDPARAVGGALVAAAVAVAAERPRVAGLDDDLAMTVLPAIALWAVGLLGPNPPLAPP